MGLCDGMALNTEKSWALYKWRRHDTGKVHIAQKALEDAWKAT